MKVSRVNRYKWHSVSRRRLAVGLVAKQVAVFAERNVYKIGTDRIWCRFVISSRHVIIGQARVQSLVSPSGILCQEKQEWDGFYCRAFRCPLSAMPAMLNILFTTHEYRKAQYQWTQCNSYVKKKLSQSSVIKEQQSKEDQLGLITIN
jgi:hypothetical protein